MLCSLNWLGEYLDLKVAAQELAERLTLAGLEAKVWPRYPQPPEGVVAASILAVEPHPKAERLSVCTVETGSGQVRVVCGAANVRPGLVSPLAPPGARLAGGRKVEKVVIRGVESCGMLCAEDELGLSEDHSGVMELDQAVAPGQALEEIVGLDDYLLEVDLTPNRGDCACVLGLAREAAGLFGAELRRPDLSYPEQGQPIEALAKVTIHDPDLCPRYMASLLSGLESKTSPWWLREKIISAGMRPISNLVDVTNFVMLELGQPLHAFDFTRLEGREIQVRRAKAGERFVTLDGREHVLEEGMLLICDGSRPVALAGLMGGLNSEVEAATSQVLIEAACFEPLNNRRTATRLGLQTEASYRFQRGVDPLGTPLALRRASKLMAELGGGFVHPGLIDANPIPFTPARISLRVARCNSYLGTAYSGQKMAGLLRSIEIEAECRAERIEVVAPSWRPDLTREVDLIEEVARLAGYDQIPSTFPPMSAPAARKPALEALAEKTRAILTGLGLFETINYVFTPTEAEKMLGWKDPQPPVLLLNPLAEDQAALRPSLLWGLLKTLALNLRHGAEGVRIFEWGNVFRSQGPNLQPAEEAHLAAVMAGQREPTAWCSSRSKVDFYDLKGVLEGLLIGLGISGARFEACPRPEYQPGASAQVSVEGQVLGYLGRLSEAALASFDLKEPAFAFEISAATLLDLAGRPSPEFQLPPRFPAIIRDLAIVVPADLEAAQLLAFAGEVADPLIAGVSLFDLYQGSPLPPDQKSFGLRIRYQSSERTLTEAEVAPLHNRLINHLLTRTGGVLRR